MFEHDKPFKATRITSGLNQEVRDVADLVLKTRFVEALRDGTTSYPIYRELRFAARIGLEMLFDDLALKLGWRAQRLGTGRMILDADGLFISAYGGRKAAYCSAMALLAAEGETYSLAEVYKAYESAKRAAAPSGQVATIGTSPRA